MYQPFDSKRSESHFPIQARPMNLESKLDMLSGEILKFPCGYHE
jgi:hypothetical protein